MKLISFEKVVEEVKKLCMKANYVLPSDVKKAFNTSVNSEETPLGSSILKQCIDNYQVAEKENIPMCQDTGLSVFFIKYGNIKIEGGSLNDAINEGVRQGHQEGYLRKSVVIDPLYDRTNTGDNTPAIIHLDLVEDDSLEIVYFPKGGGSENMGQIKMMKPADGEEQIVKFAVDVVVESGGSPCPPTILGIGIGGTFEHVALLAKKALLRPIGSINPDPRYAELESKILKEVNSTGVGPQGLGGRTSSFAVHIEKHPCHIASMPVAINLNCHAARQASIRL